MKLFVAACSVLAFIIIAVSSIGVGSEFTNFFWDNFCVIFMLLWIFVVVLLDSYDTHIKEKKK
jgi:peptidoglycan/LPS O-acetylase OafA/YrhL